jgi:diaminopimelate decarboxylase
MREAYALGSLRAMRSDLPVAIAAAIESCSQPSLVFDLSRIEANFRAIADAARPLSITVLFAAKSFPHPAVRELAARWFDGFDAASAGELAELPDARVISVVDPSGRAGIGDAARSSRLIVGCETVEQVRAAPPRAEIAIRLSASLTARDPAVGAVQHASGHRRSRFGLDVDPERRRAAIAELVHAAAGRPIGLHVHHGPVAATSGERYVATALAALGAAADAGFTPRFLDVGGAWHAVADIPAALAELRAAVPGLELVVEPGRAIANGAGFACGRVVVARELDDRAIRVVDLSRICHLRWSQVELVASAPEPEAPLLFVGPTCFEEDVLGEWPIDPARFAAGARVVLRNVTGYAVAWNTGFGGIPPANVVIA